MRCKHCGSAAVLERVCSSCGGWNGPQRVPGPRGRARRGRGGVTRACAHRRTEVVRRANINAEAREQMRCTGCRQTFWRTA